MTYLPLGVPCTSKHCLGTEQKQTGEREKKRERPLALGLITGIEHFLMETGALSLINKPFVWELKWQSDFWTVDRLNAHKHLCTHTKPTLPLSFRPLKSTHGWHTLLFLTSYLAAHGCSQATWNYRASLRQCKHQVSTHHHPLLIILLCAHPQGSPLSPRPKREGCSLTYPPSNND